MGVAPGSKSVSNTASGPPGGGAGGSSGGSNGGLFQCFQCKRNYTRADHLARHVRSHTQEKPFPCTICLKRFSRADLLKRHFLNHDENNENKRQRRTQLPTASGRVTQACKACASAKLKCEEEKPCHRCQQKGLRCEYAQQEADRLRKRAKSALKDSIDDNTLYSHPPIHPNTTFPPVYDSSYITTTYPGTQAPTPETLVDGSINYNSDSNPYAVPSPYGDYGRDSSMHLDHPPNIHSEHHLPSQNLLNFGMMTNLELNEMDFGLLDSYNKMFMNPLGAAPMDFSHHERQLPIKTAQLTLGVEAFQKSQWKWTPTHKDRGNAEHENLCMPSGTSPKLRVPAQRAIIDRLDPAARDRILAVILTTCNFANRIHAVSSFPSAEMLDTLMNLFFQQQAESTDSWLHPGSFSPSNASPELLTAIVAGGAILTPYPAVQKLGYALQEAVRVSIPKLFEANNSATRDLHTLQAYLIQIEISLWSGNKRRIEIAESFRQPLGTMLRRSGKYRRAQYPTIVPLLSDEGETLNSRWRSWIEQQQWARLVYQLFIHDIQGSMAYQVNPIISYAELSLPLPESRPLFFARSAEQWKQLYLSTPLCGNPRLPSLQDTLHTFPSITLQPATRIDLEFAELITLYGLWGRIWSYRQCQTIGRSNEHTPAHLLTNINKNILHPRFNTPQSRLLVEVLQMSVYVSLEDLQAFAGKEDEEECLRVYPILQSWIRGRESRLAILHAGQVLREACGFKRGQLTEFWAVMVYHAAITLWSYGALMMGERESSGTPLDEGEDEVVVLDGDLGGRGIEKFVEYGRGYPRISSHQVADTDVHSPGAVMEAVCRLLEGHCMEELEEKEHLPPLVENLMVLMEELGEAAEHGR
ncbi:C2H2 type zinc finger domain protein [Pyronema domesticum]|nr:C2H2 type zinc finger domain protein [Pyronema domesticum]